MITTEGKTLIDIVTELADVAVKQGVRCVGNDICTA